MGRRRDQQQGYPPPNYSNPAFYDNQYSQPAPQDYMYPPGGVHGQPAPSAPPVAYPGTAAGPPPPTDSYGRPPVVYPPTTSRDEEAVSDGPTPWAGSSFSDKKIRAAFIRKVYLILLVQLAITIGMICLVIFIKPVKEWVKSQLWFYLLAYGIFIVLFIVLACVKKARRTFPANFICLFLFTLAFSYVAATISGFHDTKIVLIMMGITAAVVLSVSLFACQTKIDFTMCTGVLFGLFMVLFIFGILAITVQFTIGGRSNILMCVYGGLGALVFTLALIVDTQLIMGGKRYEIEEEEYIYGALNLYMDIVYIFLFLLMIFGGGGDG